MYEGRIAPRKAAGFAQDRIPPAMASICLSVSMPPALLAKAGIGVPGIPFDAALRIMLSSAIARKIGSPRPIAAPPFPLWPWHPAQFPA
jgi:hypothetical protein